MQVRAFIEALVEEEVQGALGGRERYQRQDKPKGYRCRNGHRERQLVGTFGAPTQPLQPEDIDGYRRLTAQSPIPIATGEAESELKACQRLVTDGGLDWIQPDPGRCGISTFVAAGRYAHEHGARLANHSFKSGITIAASLHALAALPNGEIFEYCMSRSPLRRELTREPFDVVDGDIRVPEAPGLGVTIDPAVFEKYRVA